MLLENGMFMHRTCKLWEKYSALFMRDTAGYCILLPDGDMITVNPDKTDVLDVSCTCNDYAVLAEEWRARRIETQRLQEEELARHLALFEKQRVCLHQDYTTTKIIEAAGCDIYDTVCTACDKILRRSWSTAYDTDPNDCIGDWCW